MPACNCPARRLFRVNCSPMAELSALRFASAVPSAEVIGASLLLSSSSWFFVRLSLMSCAAYSALALAPCGERWPSSLARLLCPLLTSAVKVIADRSSLDLVFETNGRPPEVGSPAFNAQPLDLQPMPLIDADFAVICQLVQHRRPQTRFLYIGSRLCFGASSDAAPR